MASAALDVLRRHRMPAWWTDAKLGIFVHWAPASVPAFAPVDIDIDALVQSSQPDALKDTPYAEWYGNSLRFPDSAVARHHAETYGDRPYEAFARDWEAGLEHWDPDDWARRFAATGARWVVMVTKHMDGYCLWPTEVTNPNQPRWHSTRDVVGELAEAVRGQGMRFGLYYSGGLDATFDPRPMGTVGAMLAAVPRGAYPKYADAQVRELIARYRPSVLWNDIAWPSEAKALWPLLAHYYERVPDGVINDRWIPWSPLLGAARRPRVQKLIDAGSRRQARKAGGIVPPKPPHFDYRTPEYVTFDDVQPDPWECVRGMDHSFGHNAQSRPEDFLTHDDLLWTLVDIVAKGGNLLLNVGPRGVDASIPELQQARLDWLGEWVDANGRALFATRPWVTPGAGDVRYTARDDSVFAIVHRATGPVKLPELRSTPTTSATTVDGATLGWHEGPGGLTVDLLRQPSSPEPTVVELRDVAAR